jgi:hypothetical protein
MGHLDAYFAQLPNGLASFPDYKAKASMVRTALEVLPVAADAPDLPEVLQRHLRKLPFTSSWIPEAEWIAVCLAMADVHGLDTERFREFWYATMARLTSGVYATVLSWIDPRTLLKRTAERWAMFHQGLEFSTAARGESMELVLRYPTPLLPDIIIDGYVGVLQVLIDRSRKPQGKIRLIGIDTDAAKRSSATFLAEGWLR